MTELRQQYAHTLFIVASLAIGWYIIAIFILQIWSGIANGNNCWWLNQEQEQQSYLNDAIIYYMNNTDNVENNSSLRSSSNNNYISYLEETIDLTI